MAALVPPPKRHVTVYSGVLASNSRWRNLIIPKAAAAVTPESPLRENAEMGGLPGTGDRVALLRRTFGEEVQCPDCGGRLRLIALVKKEETIRAVLTALHYPPGALPAGPPKEAKVSSWVARENDFSGSGRGTDESTDRPEYPD